MRRSALGCGAALVLLAGCGTATAGKPVATGDPPRSSTVEPPATSDAPDYSLGRLCELLSPDEARRMGGSAQGKDGFSTKDGHALCTWADETSLIVGVQPGVKVNGGNKGAGITNTPITVDGLPATQSLETKPIVTCQVLIDLPDDNLFSTSAGTLTRGEGKYDSCALAKQMADFIVPRVKEQ